MDSGRTANLELTRGLRFETEKVFGMVGDFVQVSHMGEATGDNARDVNFFKLLQLNGESDIDAFYIAGNDSYQKDLLASGTNLLDLLIADMTKDSLKSTGRGKHTVSMTAMDTQTASRLTEGTRANAVKNNLQVRVVKRMRDEGPRNILRGRKVVPKEQGRRNSGKPAPLHI